MLRRRGITCSARRPSRGWRTWTTWEDQFIRWSNSNSFYSLLESEVLGAGWRFFPGSYICDVLFIIEAAVSSDAFLPAAKHAGQGIIKCQLELKEEVRCSIFLLGKFCEKLWIVTIAWPWLGRRATLLEVLGGPDDPLRGRERQRARHSQIS